jgi:hypothetical protein
MMAQKIIIKPDSGFSSSVSSCLSSKQSLRVSEPTVECDYPPYGPFFEEATFFVSNTAQQLF